MTTPIELAETIARQAGDILLNLFNPSGSKSSRKSDRSIVTEADMAADRFIHAALKQAAPEASVISEELQSSLKELSDDLWVIDPLDGTTNFSLGLQHWGVSIAYFHSGKLEAAAIYFPLLGEMYTASRGKGAFLNSQPIHARPAYAGQPSSFFSCCSRTLRRYRISLPYKTRILGSAAYSLCSVARGIAVVGFEAAPKLWDMAGGWLMVEEAGGIVELFDKNQQLKIQPGVDYAAIIMPFLAAASPEALARARSQIIPL